MPVRVVARMPSARIGNVLGLSTHRHGTWVSCPFLRLVTASFLWSTLIRSPHGSDVESNGPR